MTMCHGSLLRTWMISNAITHFVGMCKLATGIRVVEHQASASDKGKGVDLELPIMISIVYLREIRHQHTMTCV